MGLVVHLVLSVLSDTTIVSGSFRRNRCRISSLDSLALRFLFIRLLAFRSWPLLIGSSGSRLHEDCGSSGEASRNCNVLLSKLSSGLISRFFRTEAMHGLEVNPLFTPNHLFQQAPIFLFRPLLSYFIIHRSPFGTTTVLKVKWSVHFSIIVVKNGPISKFGGTLPSPLSMKTSGGFGSRVVVAKKGLELPNTLFASASNAVYEGESLLCPWFFELLLTGWLPPNGWLSLFRWASTLAGVDPTSVRNPGREF